MNSFIKKLFLIPIWIYQYSISPLFPSACRFSPTCSQYAKEAIEKHGVWRGIGLGVRRIAKCHPWGSSGYDPVP